MCTACLMLCCTESSIATWEANCSCVMCTSWRFFSSYIRNMTPAHCDHDDLLHDLFSFLKPDGTEQGHHFPFIHTCFGIVWLCAHSMVWDGPVSLLRHCSSVPLLGLCSLVPYININIRVHTYKTALGYWPNEALSRIRINTIEKVHRYSQTWSTQSCSPH